jgi:hypothetical protein
VKIYKLMAVILCSVLSCAVFMPAAKADEWDQKTKVEFNEPVEISGRILPAGTYWFVLENSASDRDIVQIFTGDWSKLEATLQTIPTERQYAKDLTEMVFAERLQQKPEALLKWYYPGFMTGHEFLYSGKREREFAREAKRAVVVQSTGL